LQIVLKKSTGKTGGPSRWNIPKTEGGHDIVKGEERDSLRTQWGAREKPKKQPQRTDQKKNQEQRNKIRPRKKVTSETQGGKKIPQIGNGQDPKGRGKATTKGHGNTSIRKGGKKNKLPALPNTTQRMEGGPTGALPANSRRNRVKIA